jgi:hypothetical protein
MCAIFYIQASETVVFVWIPIFCLRNFYIYLLLNSPIDDEIYIYLSKIRVKINYGFDFKNSSY